MRKEDKSTIIEQIAATVAGVFLFLLPALLSV